jgi:hypothetical protein
MTLEWVVGELHVKSAPQSRQCAAGDRDSLVHGAGGYRFHAATSKVTRLNRERLLFVGRPGQAT